MSTIYSSRFSFDSSYVKGNNRSISKKKKKKKTGTFIHRFCFRFPYLLSTLSTFSFFRPWKDSSVSKHSLVTQIAYTYRKRLAVQFTRTHILYIHTYIHTYTHTNSLYHWLTLTSLLGFTLYGGGFFRSWPAKGNIKMRKTMLLPN